MHYIRILSGMIFLLACDVERINSRSYRDVKGDLALRAGLVMETSVPQPPASSPAPSQTPSCKSVSNRLPECARMEIQNIVSSGNYCSQNPPPGTPVIPGSESGVLIIDDAKRYLIGPQPLTYDGCQNCSLLMSVDYFSCSDTSIDPPRGISACVGEIFVSCPDGVYAVAMNFVNGEEIDEVPPFLACQETSGVGGTCQDLLSAPPPGVPAPFENCPAGQEVTSGNGCFSCHPGSGDNDKPEFFGPICPTPSSQPQPPSTTWSQPSTTTQSPSTTTQPATTTNPLIPSTTIERRRK